MFIERKANLREFFKTNLRDRHVLCDNFKRFQYFNFETDFPEYRFLVESTKIENASFSYIIATSEANVKTNKMATTKWTYQKEWSSASNYFIFLKILCQFKNL